MPTLNELDLYALVDAEPSESSEAIWQKISELHDTVVGDPGFSDLAYALSIASWVMSNPHARDRYDMIYNTFNQPTYNLTSASRPTHPALQSLTALSHALATPFAPPKPKGFFQDLLARLGWLKAPVPSGVRVWGKPGGNLDLGAVEKFGRENVDKGHLGEFLTSVELERLMAIPGVRIFHSLKFYGSAVADVDHAVLCGNKMALIDSKYFRPGDYRITNDNHIYRYENGTIADEDHPIAEAFNQAIFDYGYDFKTLDVRGWVLFHFSGDRQNTYDNNFHQRRRIGGSREVLDEIAAWFLEDGTGTDIHTDEGVIRKIWGRLHPVR